MNEKSLIKRCIQKDEKAMTELFNRYAYVLKTTCRRIVKDVDESNDVFQEGFIAIFKHLETFEYKSSLYSWMNRIMVNTALSNIRKKNIILTSLDIHEMDMIQDDPANEQDEGVFEYLENLDGKEILELLYLLPDKYRIILGLFAIDGLKHSEISERLGISVDLSKKIVSRARIKLLEIVKAEQNEQRKIGYIAAK